MTSQLAREEIQSKIETLRWKKCPSRVPNAPKVNVEAEIVTHFGTVDKATALDDIATCVFTDMPDGFEAQPLGTQHEIRLKTTEKATEMTVYLMFFGGKFWLSRCPL
ncbi:MAG TPA: hypothetical protein VHX68_17140 [Planctomycetaceae bacterium]|nr:hypothetical protein [Planctomycetaceae bacterium]